MPRTFRDTQTGARFYVPDDATDEQIVLKANETVKQATQDAIGVGTARKGARDADPMQTGVLPGTVTPKGQKEQQGLATAETDGLTMLEEFMGPTTPPDVKQTPPGTFSVGQESAVQAMDPYSKATTIGELGQSIYDVIRPPATRGEVIEKGALPVSLAMPIVGPAAGTAVRGAVGRVLPAAAARLAGGAARMGAGAATTGAPIATERMLAGAEPTEALKTGGIYGLLGEAAGAVGGKAYEKVFRPSKQLVPGATKAQEALVPMGATLTPGQLSKHKGIRFAETLADYGILSGGRMARTREAAHDVGQTLLREHLEDLPVRGGDVLAKAYQEVGRQGKGVRVNLRSAILDAQELVQKHEGRIPEIDKIATWVEDTLKTAPNGLVSFDRAARLRSDLLAVERKALGVLTPQKIHGAAEKLSGSVDAAMESAATRVGGDLLNTWRGTSALYRKAVFREAAEDMITAATKEGRINGTKLADGLDRLPRMKRAKLDPQELADLKEFANVLRQAESRDPNATGRMWFQLVQGGAAGGLALGRNVEEGTAVLTVPVVLSLILTNPRAVRYLTQGFRRAGSKAGIEAVRRAVAVTAGRETAGEPTEEPKLPWEP